MKDRNEKLAQQAIELLKREQHNGDQELAHVNADRIICNILKSLGYEDVVNEYYVIDKWYA